jgi:hypothetical protein
MSLVPGNGHITVQRPLCEVREIGAAPFYKTFEGEQGFGFVQGFADFNPGLELFGTPVHDHPVGLVLNGICSSRSLLIRASICPQQRFSSAITASIHATLPNGCE